MRLVDTQVIIITTVLMMVIVIYQSMRVSTASAEWKTVMSTVMSTEMEEVND